MSKNPELQKHTLNLIAGDWAELSAMLPPNVETSVFIRMLVHAKVEELRSAAKAAKPKNIEVNI